MRELTISQFIKKAARYVGGIATDANGTPFRIHWVEEGDEVEEKTCEGSTSLCSVYSGTASYWAECHPVMKGIKSSSWERGTASGGHTTSTVAMSQVSIVVVHNYDDIGLGVRGAGFRVFDRDVYISAGQYASLIKEEARLMAEARAKQEAAARQAYGKAVISELKQQLGEVYPAFSKWFGIESLSTQTKAANAFTKALSVKYTSEDLRALERFNGTWRTLPSCMERGKLNCCLLHQMAGLLLHLNSEGKLDTYQTPEATVYSPFEGLDFMLRSKSSSKGGVVKSKAA